ncbi:hypothetical protein J8J20_24855, partial [Mycobacterium tuberculosis]|nr:hypothetical protein [Mycobacterium tuberculosis]
MPVRPTRGPWITLSLSAGLFVILIGLGTWQVERLQWKEALLATIAARTHSAPQPLAEIEKIWAQD